MTGTPEIRFWAKVRKAADCWAWVGARDTCGYGHLRIAGRAVKAHRFSYELLVGPIPAGMELDHLCRVRNCVNPAHLEPVTHRVNTLRGQTVSAKAAATTHCPRGHAYDESNTIRRGNQRFCRACKAAHMATPEYKAWKAEYDRRRNAARKAAA